RRRATRHGRPSLVLRRVQGRRDLRKRLHDRHLRTRGGRHGKGGRVGVARWLARLHRSCKEPCRCERVQRCARVGSPPDAFSNGDRGDTFSRRKSGASAIRLTLSRTATAATYKGAELEVL